VLRVLKVNMENTATSDTFQYGSFECRYLLPGRNVCVSAYLEAVRGVFRAKADQPTDTLSNQPTVWNYRELNSCAAFSQLIPLISRTVWPLQMGRIGCSETSIKYQSTLLKSQKNKYLRPKADDSVHNRQSLFPLLNHFIPIYSLVCNALNNHFNCTLTVRSSSQDFPFLQVLLSHMHFPLPAT
jgi:hypothetical protein